MRFIIFGDSKGKDQGINKKILNLLMKSSKNLNPKPEFIVICGDSVAGGRNPYILNKQLNDFKNIIYSYYGSIPLIPVVGNHEVNINPLNDCYEKMFKEFYGSIISDEESLANYNKTVYYKEFSNFMLIVLNSFHYNQIHQIGDVQLNWLKKITTASKKKKILLVHSPLFPTGAHLGHCLDLYPEKRDIFLNYIEKCDIDIIICGHEHNYSRRLLTSLNNKTIMQIITGGGGEKLRDKYKSKKGVIVPPIAKFHYIIADTFDNTILFSVIDLKGNQLDSFSI